MLMEGCGAIAACPLLSPHQAMSKAFNQHNNLSLLNQCNRSTHIHQVHARLIKTNNAHNNFYLSKLLSLFIQTNHLHEARLLFDHAKRPNTLVWNTLLKAYVHNGLSFEALLLFKNMVRSGISPDSYTFPFLFKACAGVDDSNLGFSFHSVILKLGLENNLYVQNSMVDMYCKCRCVDYGRKVFDEMGERDLVSWTSIISGYAKVGEMQMAELLFGLMPEKDVVSWGAIISGFAQNDCSDEALVFFHEMQIHGIRPGEVAIVSALGACAKLGLWSLGLWLHGYVVRHGFRLSVFIGTALVDMYSKCGDIENARNLFNLMTEKSIASWNSIIGGLAMNGCAEEALSMYSEMDKAGVEPNSITLSSVLCACRHGGLVEEGFYYFDSMNREFGISPNLDHYGCMVDLLGRAGYMNEAYELIKGMPIEPNEVVWGALLGACKIHRNLKLGEYALERLVELDPQNSGNYVLLSNMYAMLGRSEDVERVREAMRDMGIEKPRGSSSVEVDSIVHEFYAGDQSHPDISKIYEKLAELYSKIEALGYSAYLDSEMYSVESF
ncbi:hypothetical protein HHK36_009297 [Tetracentron sinense]|uniref:Uncharacterized protein n=1 Tax=Tetracentron sinense TaxID=13715 RepID=A0A834ZCP8_TETSI|nr:hypothetical protein HHK36_009297 [Tetracentron sinense]